MGFRDLVLAARIQTAATSYFELVSGWEEKRTNLSVLLLDLPALVEGHRTRKEVPDAQQPRLKLIDMIPTRRLANACESAANALYGMAEIAARFANLASGGVLPASFNALRKTVEAGRAEPDLKRALGDLQWYKKVREIRTEWAHFSTVFIGGDPDDPLIAVRDHRRSSDKEEFRGHAVLSVRDFIAWVSGAIGTTDTFAEYLLRKYVLSRFDLAAEFTLPVYDSRGIPIIEGDRIRTRKTNIGDELRRLGVI